jgi:uncharacterized protein
MSLARSLAAVVGVSHRRALIVVLAGLLLAAAAVAYGRSHLGVNTDTDTLFASSLRWRQNQVAWGRAFPQFNGLLVAVIDANSPEAADETAAGLTAALAKDTAHFGEVRRPDASAYFQRNGLLFLDPKVLGDLLDRTIDAQPFLGQLVADPSARGLFAALSLLGMGVQRGEADLTPYAAPLAAFDHALAQAAAGHPTPLSWQTLLGGAAVAQAGPYRFVLAQARQDFSGLQPGAAATDAMRAAIARLPFVQDGSAHVRITGGVALADEEFGSVAQGMLFGTLASIALITLWLTLAVRSWRLIVAILGTLLAGLAYTLGFAAVAVGTLNVVSLAFAILFVGIAVDFAIQVAVRFRERLYLTGTTAAALHAVAVDVGPEVAVAAAATACGFLAFVPTDFAGVAELGLIAGVGMLIAFACTFTLLPALLTLLRPRGERTPVGMPGGAALERRLVRMRRPLLGGFVLLALAGVVAVPSLQFDSDPLHTKDASTEAMRTLHDLMGSPLTNPYSINILALSQADADALAAKLRGLKLVDSVLTLSSFVPGDQDEKLALITDAAGILAPTLAPHTPAAPVTASDLRLAAESTAAQLDAALPKLPADHPLRAIDADLHKLADQPDDVLLAANAALTRFLPAQLERLRAVLDAKPVTTADIPEEIARDWRLPDGRVRVQVLGTPQTRSSQGLRQLVEEVRTLAPDAVGSAVTIVSSADTIIGAFRSAAVSALIAIGVILGLALRRVREVALVMAPLVLGALLTALIVRVCGFALNFANVIALPLLLGVGVSFNVYFVMDWRAGARQFLGTATARAIVFSALTTGSAFGTLALSGHPGTASMGLLLLLSLGCTLIATLLFLPPLLQSLRAPPG